MLRDTHLDVIFSDNTGIFALENSIFQHVSRLLESLRERNPVKTKHDAL